MNWRDLNRKAMKDVHRQFQIPAVYLSHSGGIPIPVYVRLHRKADQTNGYSEFDFGMAANVTTMVDSIIFEASSVEDFVLTSAHVIFSEDEAYITGASFPERRGYIRVEVSAMSKVDIARLLDEVDVSTPEWSEIFPIGLTDQ